MWGKITLCSWTVAYHALGVDGIECDPTVGTVCNNPHFSLNVSMHVLAQVQGHDPTRAVRE